DVQQARRSPRIQPLVSQAGCEVVRSGRHGYLAEKAHCFNEHRVPGCGGEIPFSRRCGGGQYRGVRCPAFEQADDGAPFASAWQTDKTSMSHERLPSKSLTPVQPARAFLSMFWAVGQMGQIGQ